MASSPCQGLALPQEVGGGVWQVPADNNTQKLFLLKICTERKTKEVVGVFQPPHPPLKQPLLVLVHFFWQSSEQSQPCHYMQPFGYRTVFLRMFTSEAAKQIPDVQATVSGTLWNGDTRVELKYSPLFSGYSFSFTPPPFLGSPQEICCFS